MTKEVASDSKHRVRGAIHVKKARPNQNKLRAQMLPISPHVVHEACPIVYEKHIVFRHTRVRKNVPPKT